MNAERNTTFAKKASSMPHNHMQVAKEHLLHDFDDSDMAEPAGHSSAMVFDVITSKLNTWRFAQDSWHTD